MTIINRFIPVKVPRVFGVDSLTLMPRAYHDGTKILLLGSFHLTESAKGETLKSMGWHQIENNPTINKSFASDVADIRKTDLDQVITDFHTLFGGGYSHSIFVTGTSSSAYQPLLTAAATIFGRTPELGSYLPSVGIDAIDSRFPQFVIFIEKESMEGQEHQLAVFAHEYYHIYQNARLLDQPAWVGSMLLI